MQFLRNYDTKPNTILFDSNVKFNATFYDT